MSFWRNICLALGFTAALDTAGDVDLLIFGTTGVTPPSPWFVKTKKGRADVKLRTAAQRAAVCLASEKASFAIQRNMKVDTRNTPLLHWTWLAETLPPNGDLRDSDRDDQAAQLFVLFGGRRAISYVWDSNAPVGTKASTTIPLFVDIRILVVQHGAAQVGSWISYRRNVRDDYRKLFGVDPPDDVAGIRFQINSQYTRTTARSCLAEVKFTN